MHIIPRLALTQVFTCPVVQHRAVCPRWVTFQQQQELLARLLPQMSGPMNLYPLERGRSGKARLIMGAGSLEGELLLTWSKLYLISPCKGLRLLLSAHGCTPGMGLAQSLARSWGTPVLGSKSSQGRPMGFHKDKFVLASLGKVVHLLMMEG